MKTSARQVLMLLAAASVVVGSAVIVATQPAKAVPKYTAETGKGCPVCHTNGSGGGKLTATGEKFKANGNKF